MLCVAVDDAALPALAAVVATLPGGEVREGQARMASAVAAAIDSGRHLLVQAGTGTGKSLAYLVPAVVSAKRVVVATATKALQEQLVAKDLPVVAAALREHSGREVTFALLKGRSNYLCLQRAAGLADGQLTLEDRTTASDVARVVEWLATTEKGDRSELNPGVSDRAWAALSMSPGECPGAQRCPHGTECFAELARADAAAADVVVVNHHLLALDLATGGAVLPERDVIVVDEAHELEDVVAAAWGAELGPGGLERLVRRAAPYLGAEGVEALTDATGEVVEVLRTLPAGRLTALPDPLAAACTGLTGELARATTALEGERKEADAAADEERVTSLLGVLGAVASVTTVLGRVLARREDDVVWVEGGGVLKVAPVDVGPALAQRLWGGSTAVVATSATLAVGGSFELPARRLGLPPDEEMWTGLDVGSPFDHRRQAMLYTPRRLPVPPSAAHAEAVWDELAALIEAAGGRTLGLFTSRAAVLAAAEALAPRVTVPLHVQGDAAPGVLVREFADDERSCLLGTTSFWQGVDVPGPSCTVVAIDKLPFPRRDDPLAAARVEAADAAGRSGFEEVYLARCALLLAQGVGRLVRGATDRGVVAILDPRLSTARYGSLLVRSLPEMTRWYDREPVLAALRRLTGSG
jgi:ATP-dependent DNA helicase DinG